MKHNGYQLAMPSLLLVLVLVLTACGGSGAATDSGTAAVERSESNNTDPAAAENVGTIRLAWFPDSIKSSLTNVAYQLGYFEEEGVTIVVERLQSSSDALTALDLGKVDITPNGITQQLQFISEGSDLVIIGGSAQEGGAIITTQERAEEFAEIGENWRGASWATGRTFTGDYVIRDRLRQAGIIPEEDIAIVDLSTNLPIIEAVEKGTVDVGYITADGVAIAEAMGLSIGIRVGDLDPYYPCCRQTVRAEAVAENREAFVAYQRALIRAYKVIESDPEQAIAVMIDSTQQEREYVEIGLYGKYASLYNPSPAVTKVEDFYQYLLQEGTVTNSELDIKDKVDASIFREALEEILERYPDDEDYLRLKAYSDEVDVY